MEHTKICWICYWNMHFIVWLLIQGKGYNYHNFIFILCPSKHELLLHFQWGFCSRNCWAYQSFFLLTNSDISRGNKYRETFLWVFWISTFRPISLIKIKRGSSIPLFLDLLCWILLSVSSSEQLSPSLLKKSRPTYILRWHVTIFITKIAINFTGLIIVNYFFWILLTQMFPFCKIGHCVFGKQKIK